MENWLLTQTNEIELNWIGNAHIFWEQYKFWRFKQVTSIWREVVRNPLQHRNMNMSMNVAVKLNYEIWIFFLYSICLLLFLFQI